MSFKVHLLIISVIILMVYVGWMFLNREPTLVATRLVNAPKQQITVVHASWGMNCLRSTGAAATPSAVNDAYVSKDAKNKLHEDNVLATVAKLCNGQTECDIAADPTVLGD